METLIPCYESRHGASIAIHTQPYLVTPAMESVAPHFRQRREIPSRNGGAQ